MPILPGSPRAPLLIIRLLTLLVVSRGLSMLRLLSILLAVAGGLGIALLRVARLTVLGLLAVALLRRVATLVVITLVLVVRSRHCCDNLEHVKCD